MITLLRSGAYRLFETRQHTKILCLDSDMYAWVEPRHIGEILVISHKVHHEDCVLSVGQYRLYDVKKEPRLSDLKHLELEVGDNIWQGYFLLSDLPTDAKKRIRIIPTNEIITGNAQRVRLKKLLQPSKV